MTADLDPLLARRLITLRCARRRAGGGLGRRAARGAATPPVQPRAVSDLARAAVPVARLTRGRATCAPRSRRRRCERRRVRPTRDRLWARIGTSRSCSGGSWPGTCAASRIRRCRSRTWAAMAGARARCPARGALILGRRAFALAAVAAAGAAIGVATGHWPVRDATRLAGDIGGVGRGGRARLGLRGAAVRRRREPDIAGMRAGRLPLVLAFGCVWSGARRCWPCSSAFVPFAVCSTVFPVGDRRARSRLPARHRACSRSATPAPVAPRPGRRGARRLRGRRRAAVRPCRASPRPRTCRGALGTRAHGQARRRRATSGRTATGR